MTTTDHRKAAEEQIQRLVAVLRDAHAAGFDGLVRECDALATAIRAFHMEGIRFRMFNVDRMLTHGQIAVPAEAIAAFKAAREELEAAGFHTRSHQAPT